MFGHFRKEKVSWSEKLDRNLNCLNYRLMKQRRRKLGPAFKAEVALEAIKGIKTISEIAQHYELHPVQVSQWKTEFLAHSAEVFEGEKKHREEIERLKSERDEPFKQIGELRFQNEWIKKNFIYEHA
jgi:transposase